MRNIKCIEPLCMVSVIQIKYFNFLFGIVLVLRKEGGGQASNVRLVKLNLNSNATLPQKEKMSSIHWLFFQQSLFSPTIDKVFISVIYLAEYKPFLKSTLKISIIRQLSYWSDWDSK